MEETTVSIFQSIVSCKLSNLVIAPVQERKVLRLDNIRVYGLSKWDECVVWENKANGSITNNGTGNEFWFISEDDEIRQLPNWFTQIPEAFLRNRKRSLLATGIVGYYLRNRHLFKPSQYQKFFECYFYDCRAKYIEDNTDLIDGFDYELEKKFIFHDHMESENQLFEQSKSILEYLPKDEGDLINKLFKRYTEFYENKVRQLYPETTALVVEKKFSKIVAKAKVTWNKIKNAAIHCVEEGLFWASKAWGVVYTIAHNWGQDIRQSEFVAMVKTWGTSSTYQSVTNQSISQITRNGNLNGTPEDWKKRNLNARIWNLGVKLEEQLALS